MLGPKHPNAQMYITRGLFRDLESFAQLEERISALSTTKERGDAFEVFAEAYLVTQGGVQAKDVWPFEEIPRRLRTKHALDTARDMGVDGVYESNLGALNAYQVKFRSNRQKLRWEDLSTFMGLTEQVDQRVLFTNSDDLPRLMNDRNDFFCIRGADLDRLEAHDFAEIATWLESASFIHVRKTPRDYQQEAVDAISSQLETEDRATAILACGTGKTLIGLWIAEDVADCNVLVLEPSLALIRQTLHEWVKETSWNNCGFLCVCSDPTVAKGQDQVIVQQSDLDFPVTTDPEGVAKFLRSRKIDKRIVFSTYHSAHVIAEAVPKKFRFDIGLFDEAHKTAGRENLKFSFALKNDNLFIRKRVFLTATPRHYDIRNKNKEGDAKLVYSMDVPESYGPRAYTLSFREAANRDIICDFKVLISVVTDDMINDELLRRGEVVVEGDVVKARQVANQVALQKAVAQFDVGRIFTFHRSVASAKSFVAPGGEGVESHLPAFNTYHVNGAMRTAKRDELIQEFRKADRGIMTNARCLTEGVDVPAVDMVAFMSPKKSKVDIVQAAGRAMRKAPDKEVGYVLVPLYLEQEEGETVEDALERTDFGEVWNVLQAMQEQDEELADIIRELREERGRTKGFDDSRFRERVEVLGPLVLLDDLRESITATCIDQLGATWDERFGELAAYKEKYGDCDPPAIWPSNRPLGHWAAIQRVFRKQGKLSEDRIARLDALEFTWDVISSLWERMYGELVDFHREHGHTRVSKKDGLQALLNWSYLQRQSHREGKVSEDRITRLEALDFDWRSRHAAKWEQMLEALAAYREDFGDCLVPQDWPDNPALGAWVAKQRTLYKHGKLSAARLTRLKSLGMVWNQTEAIWEQMYALLAAFHKAHGHCLVPQNWLDNPQLGVWTNNQRQRYKKGRLSTKEIEKLDALDFVWDAREARWEEMSQKLEEYRKVHGHCRVPIPFADDPSFSQWVDYQRLNYRKGKLSEERIRRLEALDIIWYPQDENWENKYAALTQFHRIHGHADVPQNWPDDPSLGSWVGTQRTSRKAGKLSVGRIKQLDELGFKWIY